MNRRTITHQLKVKDHPGLIRDPYSKAIINTDLNALQEHRKKIQFENTVKENNQKINKMENDMAEIKAMLNMLISKNNNG
jgi:hypothetical protein